MIQNLVAAKNLSIYITGDTIRIIEGRKTGGTISVSKVITTPTPSGSVDDGLITDVTRIAQAINSVLDKKDMAKAKLYFSVYSRKIAAKEIEMPYMKNLEAVGAMINSNIDDYFPMGNMDDYINRFTILDTVEKEGRKSYQIVVYAILKELVESYFELAKALKMPLESIDYQVNSLYNLAKRESRHSTSLFLQIDDDVTHISIFRGTSQLFRRSVPYGADSLVEALAASKGIDEKEARAILIKGKTNDDTGYQIDDYLTSDEYQDMMQDFASSITRVINFFISKNPDIVLEKAKIIGTGVRIVNIDKSLEHILGGIPVTLIKHLHHVHIRKTKGEAKLTNEELTDYLPNIGALIHPLDLRLTEEVSFAKGGIGYGLIFFLLVLAILGVGGGSGFVFWQNNTLENEKDFLIRFNESLQAAEDYHLYYLGARDFINTLSGYDAGTKNDSEALLQLIETLEDIMPSTVRLNDLAIENGKVAISANSYSGKEGAARFLMELKKQDFISNIFISDITDTLDRTYNIVSHFSMTLEISLPADTEILENEGGA
ncbi:MAG: pilus assembly protein PilM [Lachnospiraceae bacterium]|nr:pilus assembly protein PilM [Lachnospiraceae bacterium]